MPIFNSIFSWWMKKRAHQIELFLKYPIEVQNEWFGELITTAKNTEFGQKHKFSSFDNVNQYKETVPVQDYDDLKPYVDRLKKGEQNLISPTETKCHAKSPGTTLTNSKPIPDPREH